MKDKLISATEACKFCGQIVQMELPERFTDEERQEEAIKNCNCDEAKAYTRILEKIAQGEAAVKALFKEYQDLGLDTVRDILLKSVAPCVRGEISGLSTGHGGYTGSIKPSKDGVKASLKHTTVDSIEA